MFQNVGLGNPRMKARDAPANSEAPTRVIPASLIRCRFCNTDIQCRSRSMPVRWANWAKRTGVISTVGSKVLQRVSFSDIRLTLKKKP